MMHGESRYEELEDFDVVMHCWGILEYRYSSNL